MGKKKNKKFNRKATHSLSNQAFASGSVQSEIKNGDSSVGSLVPERDKKTDVLEMLNQKYSYVRRDMRILLASILGLIVFLAVIYFTNAKTDFLMTVGNWIYKIGNFQI